MPIDVLVIIALVLVLLALGVTVWLLLTTRRRQESLPQEEIFARAMESLKTELLSQHLEGLTALRNSLDTAQKLLNDRLAENTTTLDRRLELFGEIEKKLGQLEVQAKNIAEIGKNIQSLSELLKPPKLRGNLGELLLENLLAQILPSHLYHLQYRFENGQHVDAVVKIGDKLLPIDSKFPLDMFPSLASAGDDASSSVKKMERSLKQHIDAIHAKYIRPDQKTTEFALMYLPSEAVYYELVSRTDVRLLEYALARRVIPSSPGHLYAFLATVASLYLDLGLASDTSRLAAGVNALAESLEKIVSLHERMEGSLRTLSGNLSKAKEVSSVMTDQLGKLQEPLEAPPKKDEIRPHQAD